MAKKYIMGNRSDGQSDVLVQDELNFDDVPAGGGLDLWFNTSTPADLTHVSDPTVGHEFMHEPPDGGAIFRIVSFAPNTFEGMSPTEVRQMHEGINSVHIPSIEYLEKAKHPSMHRTDTLNYFIVLSGRMWALTEGEDVLVEPGDILIQHGCMHGWRIEGDVPCVMAAVLVDGTWPKGSESPAQ
jgi:mannose-6-phosphate isomerase-like protein (cupin superfamily)